MAQEIKKGQIWLVETDSIFLAERLNDDETSWIGNRIEATGGITQDVGVQVTQFIRKLSTAEAYDVAMTYMENKVKALLRTS